jgi:hypothetical protein
MTGRRGRLAVLAAAARTVCSSGPAGPRPGDRSGAFLACCPDGPRSRSDSLRCAGSSSPCTT